MDDSLSVQSTDSISVSLPIAGVGSRSYAFLIDWHIRFLLALAWFFGVLLVYKLTGLTTPEKILGSDDNSFILIAALPTFVIYFFYHPVLEMWRKQTPGKRMAKVRLVTRDGRTPGTSAMLTRNIFRLVDSLPTFYILGLGFTLFSKDHVRIGDIAAKTVLIHDEALNSELLQEMIDDSGLSLADRELLHDLLERWDELLRPTRTRLAVKFLLRFHIEVPAANSMKETDALLLEQLTALKQQNQPQ